MAEYKTELQKEIPENDTVQQPAGAPVPGSPDSKGCPERNHKRLGCPAPSEPPAQGSVAQGPKPQQAEQSPPETVLTIKTRTADAVKFIGLIQWQETWKWAKNKLFVSQSGVSAARQKTMAVSIPVLFAVFVSVWFFAAPSAETSKTQKGKRTNAAAVAGTAVDWQLPDPYSETMRDPMQFSHEMSVQSEGGRPVVKGIVYSEDRPSAVIGSEIVHEGEKVLGVTVVKINKNSVDFEMNGEKWTQKVQQ